MFSVFCIIRRFQVTVQVSSQSVILHLCKAQTPFIKVLIFFSELTSNFRVDSNSNLKRNINLIVCFQLLSTPPLFTNTSILFLTITAQINSAIAWISWLESSERATMGKGTSRKRTFLFLSSTFMLLLSVIMLLAYYQLKVKEFEQKRNWN